MSRSLKQWEEYLSGAMPRVRLLSELGLNYQDMLEIASLIKGENAKRPNVHRTTAYLVDNFPCTFVAFLAAFAAQNTEREFWDALARLLEVSSGDLNNAKWRNYFIDILENNKKTTFDTVGFKYVANMRIHGGIPSYSLRDFFSNMLLPSIEKPEYIELKGKELLDALLERSAVQFFTDSTVRNFFEYSDEIGLEFLESSRRIAREYRSKKKISPGHNLPEYVVQRLINFLEYREDEIHGLRHPRVKFDVDGDGLLLELPGEPLSGADVHGNQARWQVYQNHQLVKEINSRILPSGRDVLTAEQTIPIGYMVEPFQVRFGVPDKDGGFHQMREWTFDIRSQDVSNFFVFREDWALLRWSQALPAQTLLLVYPKDVSLVFEGNARLIHTPEIYAEGWNKWQANYFSLEGAWSLSLKKGDEVIAVIPIQKQLELPRLIGNAFEPNLDPKPLYIGRPPKLWISLRPGVRAEDELKHWHVEINSVWEAQPSLRQSFRLSEKSESVVLDKNALEFDLGNILGSEPKGTFTLRVRGPLEIDVEFEFRVWPSLHIKDLPEFILPTEDQKTVLQFVLPVHAYLEPQAGETGIRIKGQYGQYDAEFDETVSLLDLKLSWPLEASIIHVPFSLPAPRIQWRLVLGEDSKVEWTNQPIRKSVDVFLQSTNTVALILRMPRIERHLDHLVLQLVDPEKPNQALQEFPVQASVLGGDHVRFVLNANDTINQHRDLSVVEFQLLLANKEGLYQRIVLFSLTREIDLSDIHIEETDDSLFLLWKEPSPLRNRRVFIRSIWKVWVDAWNIKIPNEAYGRYDLLSAGYGLPPSWYEVHFYVAPSWEQDIAAAPDHSTYIVRTISPEDQITWLDKQLGKHPEQSFLNHFERAGIYATVGDATKLDQEIQFCYTHLDQAGPKILLAFHEWLEKHEPTTRRAVRMKMYNPEHLQNLFANYKPGDDFRKKYQRYATETQLKAESALLLIENENDPFIVFHCLRELIKRRDNRLLGIIALLIEDGRLSDADALRLLRLDEQFYLTELDSSEATKTNLRLLSALLHNKGELLWAVSLEKILNLAKAELNTELIKKYLTILIVKEDKRGVEFVMELFQSGRLLGGEVTDLLGVNPKFSTQVLSALPYTQMYSVQLSELASRFPLETGHVSLGMFVKTPAGWGRVEAMTDENNANFQVALVKDNLIKYYYIALDPSSGYPIKAIIDVEKQELRLLNVEQLFKCGHCEFISLDQSSILRFHTRNAHPGISPSFKAISSHTTIQSELEFGQPTPDSKGLSSRPDPELRTAIGIIATDPLSIAVAKKRQIKNKRRKINRGQNGNSST
jgi:hypothetical protein